MTKDEKLQALREAYERKNQEVDKLEDRITQLFDENQKLKDAVEWKDKLYGAVSLGMDRALQTVLNNERRERNRKEGHLPWGASTGKTGVKLMWNLIAEEMKGIGATKFPTYDEERLEQPGEKEREQEQAHAEALTIQTELTKSKAS